MSRQQLRGSRFVHVLAWALLPMLVNAAQAETCKKCPSAEMVPEADSFYVLGAKVMHCSQTGDTSERCDKMKQAYGAISCRMESDAKLRADEEWKKFAANYKSPCDPIPAQFLKSDGPYFSKLLSVISPKIVVNGTEPYPPANIRDIVKTIADKNAEAGVAPEKNDQRVTYPFVGATEKKLSGESEAPVPQCSENNRERCCGPIRNASLNVDLQTRESGSTLTFATTHYFNAFMGRKGAGEHLFDSEMMNYRFTAPGADGMVYMWGMSFSRHARGTEVFARTQFCDSANAYTMGKDGTHPLAFEATGSHALYLDAKTEGVFRTAEKTDSIAEKMFAGAAGSLERRAITGDDVSIDETRSGYLNSAPGKCMGSVPTNRFAGVGSLWNDPSIGANRDGALSPKTSEGDVCVIQNDKSPPMQQSVRYLSEWMTASGGLARLGCGRAPGSK